MSGEEETAGGDESFEAALEELERIVRRLDRDEMSLDEAMEAFEAGVGHLRRASSLLDETRGRVRELVEDAAGEIEAVEFELPDEDEEDGPGG